MESKNIRVLRVVEYVGPREAVEQQIAKSLHGSAVVGGRTAVIITAADLGEFPGDARADRHLEDTLLAAHKNSQRHTDLAIIALRALGWPEPQTRSEKTIAAQDAQHALDETYVSWGGSHARSAPFPSAIAFTAQVRQTAADLHSYAERALAAIQGHDPWFELTFDEKTRRAAEALHALRHDDPPDHFWLKPDYWPAFRDGVRAAFEADQARRSK